LNKTSVTAINTKYLGGYRTEKLARVKAMRFYLGYINHLGRLQKKSARLVRQAHQPVRQAHQLVRQAGFTITEVLLASSMMLIAISVAGIGVTNLLRSNYRANAGTEIQNNLNRTLEFVSDDLRRARIIVETEANIVTTKVPQARAAGARPVLAFQISDPNNPGQAPLNEQIVYYTQNSLNRTLEFVSDEVRRAKTIADSEAAITSTQVPTGARPVLAFQISDPNNPGQAPLNEQIVYYTQNSQTGDSLTGLVLWRYGPNLDENGNYITPEDIDSWIPSPVTDMLAAAANNPNCPTGFTRIPADTVDGFYACIRAGGGQVILNANAEVEMTTVTNGNRDKVDYSVSTRVSPRATD
jgi:type II secretory pathway component PulJ